MARNIKTRDFSSDELLTVCRNKAGFVDVIDGEQLDLLDALEPIDQANFSDAIKRRGSCPGLEE